MDSSPLTLGKALASTIGKKLITGVTGLALTLFVFGHLAGNLLLLAPGSEPFNLYAHKLMSLGPLLWTIEAGLALFFIAHVVNGVKVARSKRQARPVGYKMVHSQGGKSRQNFSSRSMPLTGLVLLVFTISHLVHFKFGIHYTTTIAGVGEVRDLHRLVVEFFSQLPNVVMYSTVMVLLGVHLRHGFWSAFQSLGAIKPVWSNTLHGLALVVGALLAVGFIFIPVWIFLNA